MLPLLTAIAGFAIAAIGGFFIGVNYERTRATRSRPIIATPEEAPADDSGADRRRFAEACRDGGTIVVARLDAADTWRRTHGQTTVDHLSRQVREVIAERLDPRAAIADGPASELLLLSLPSGGDETADATAAVVWPAIDAVRSHRFVDRSGEAVHATASFGAVCVRPEERPTEAIAHAQHAAGEAGRFGRNGLCVWTSGGIRRMERPA